MELKRTHRVDDLSKEATKVLHQLEEPVEGTLGEHFLVYLVEECVVEPHEDQVEESL